MSNPLQLRLSTTSKSSVVDGRGIWIATIVVVGAAFWLLPAFRTSVNILSILWQLAPVLLIAGGQALVILMAGIDLSVGAVAGLATVVFTVVIAGTGRIELGFIAAVVAGLLVGLANGLGTIGGVNPLLMTFAAAGVIQGIALTLQATAPRAVKAEHMKFLTATVGDVPVTLIAALAVILALWLWIATTRWGLRVFAIGWDTRMATRIGLPVRTVTVVGYALCGLTAALGGLAIQARTYTADALIGESNIIGSIAVVMVAGIAITGGKGSLLNVIPAAVILTVADQAVVLTGIPTYWVTIMNGAILIFAVWIYGVSLDRLKELFVLRRPSAEQPQEGTA